MIAVICLRILVSAKWIQRNNQTQYNKLDVYKFIIQGFASGSLDADAESVWIFVADGGECFAAQSYAKNKGLYGKRVSALSIVSHTVLIPTVVYY